MAFRGVLKIKVGWWENFKISFWEVGGGGPKRVKLVKSMENCQFANLPQHIATLFSPLGSFSLPFSVGLGWGGGGSEYAPDGIQSCLIDSPIMSNICVCLDTAPSAAAILTHIKHYITRALHILFIYVVLLLMNYTCRIERVLKLMVWYGESNVYVSTCLLEK